MILVATLVALITQSGKERRGADLSVVPPQPSDRGIVTPRIAEFLDRIQPQTPCLVVDLEVVEGNYRGLAAALDPAELYYAVKANPAPEILRLLARNNGRFDVASRGEIDQCLEVGIPADRRAFGNPIKKQSDIAYAFGRGVRLFAFDSEGELEKLAVAAPGATVRLLLADASSLPLRPDNPWRSARRRAASRTACSRPASRPPPRQE